MDVFSHFAVPYLLMWIARRPHRERLAAAVGGYAPDADVLTAPLAALVPELYFLGHRGLSHTAIGAPLYALGVVLLLRLRLWSRWTRHAEPLRFGARLAVIALAFSYTHLALDATTMWGIPLGWPFSEERVTTGWLFYSVLLMVPPSAYLVWKILRQEATPRRLRVAGALLLGGLVLAGGVRAATYPRGADADVWQPSSGEWTWTTLQRTSSGWNATFWSWGRAVGNATYAEVPPPTDDAFFALETAKASLPYRKFHLYAGGPEVVQVEEATPGQWNVTFLDLMVRAQVDRAPSWLHLGEDRGMLKLVVAGDDVRKRD